MAPDRNIVKYLTRSDSEMNQFSKTSVALKHESTVWGTVVVHWSLQSFVDKLLDHKHDYIKGNASMILEYERFREQTQDGRHH